MSEKRGFVPESENIVVGKPTKEEIKGNPHLLIGRVYAEFMVERWKWDDAARANDKTAMGIASKRMEKLRPDMERECREAALTRFGYSKDAAYVYIQPFHSIGWGEHGSAKGGIPAQDIYDGEPVRVKVDEIFWNVSLRAIARMEIYTYMPDNNRVQAKLVSNPV